jgi:tyrosyl-tRNA synthetase
MIHGIEATIAVERASTILFGGTVTVHVPANVTTSNPNLSLEEALKAVGAASLLNSIVEDLPNVQVERPKFEGSGIPLVELLVHAGLCPSKGQARKDIEGGGVNINNAREASATRAVTTADLLFGKHILLRKGKKNYVVVTAK